MDFGMTFLQIPLWVIMIEVDKGNQMTSFPSADVN